MNRRPAGHHSPLWSGDATYVRAKIDEPSSVMKQQADANGATYVDIRSSSVSYDSCALPGVG
ncbi:MAG: hypothetical protein ABI345_04635 [Jatrophihabitans sp.]